MVKVRFGKPEYDALKKFEKLHHPDIWAWIVDKVTEGDPNKPLRILDISDEPSIFAFMFAEQFPSNTITCAILKGAQMPNIDLPKNVNVLNITKYEDIQASGQYDVVILKELTKEIKDLGALIVQIRKIFGEEKGKIILMTRPKNPPLPLPECCIPLWTKIAFTREEVIDASNKAGMVCTCFSASVPCSVPKFDWEAILFSGCFPVVKNSDKCTSEVITNYCKSKPPKISFEEKISMFLLKTPDNPPPQ